MMRCKLFHGKGYGPEVLEENVNAWLAEQQPSFLMTKTHLSGNSNGWVIAVFYYERQEKLHEPADAS